MESIGAFLANTYIIFIIIAVFAIFALIGYIVENKTGARKMISTPTMKPQVDVENEMEKLKNNLANSDKGLNSMVGNQGAQTQNVQPEMQAPPTNNNGVINFDQLGLNPNSASSVNASNPQEVNKQV